MLTKMIGKTDRFPTAAVESSQSPTGCQAPPKPCTHMKVIFTLALVLSLAGCASAMKQDECASADWYTLGFEDGRKGAPTDQLMRYAQQCGPFGITPNSTAYAQGRTEGLTLYCTADNGFRVGRNGEDYHGVCPSHLEAAFKRRYELGYRLYALNAQISARLSEARSADYELALLTQDIHTIKLQLTRSDLSDNQRRDLTNKLERYATRAGQLEERLRYLNGEVMRLQAQLQTLAIQH